MLYKRVGCDGPGLWFVHRHHNRLQEPGSLPDKKYQNVIILQELTLGHVAECFLVDDIHERISNLLTSISNMSNLIFSGI